MALFGSSRAAATMSTTAGSLNCLHLVALTNRKMKINEIALMGNGATSASAAYQEIGAYITTGTAGAAGTALTPQKFEADSAASVCFTNFAQTTDAGVGAVALVILGCNNYGGIFRWTARPNGEIVLRNTGATATGGAGSIAYKNNNASTTAVYSLHTVWDEL